MPRLGRFAIPDLDGICRVFVLAGNGRDNDLAVVRNSPQMSDGGKLLFCAGGDVESFCRTIARNHQNWIRRVRWNEGPLDMRFAVDEICLLRHLVMPDLDLTVNASGSPEASLRVNGDCLHSHRVRA